MAEYIEKQELIKHIIKDMLLTPFHWRKHFADFVLKAPYDADVVKVVRCKDCAYMELHITNQNAMWCRVQCKYLANNPYGFCYRGTLKMGGASDEGS